MTKKLIIILALLILIIGAFGGTQYLHHKKSDDQSSSTTEATSEVTTEEVTTEETTTEASKKDDQDKDEKTKEVKDDGTIIEHDGKFDSDDSSTAARDESNVEELFRITLQYIEEYDLDSDDFKVDQALIVQDIDNDYIYFHCKHGKKSEYVCYSYDENIFRDDVKQKKLKKEYEDALVTMKYSQKEDFNYYYQFSKDEIKEVNEMY